MKNHVISIVCSLIISACAPPLRSAVYYSSIIGESGEAQESAIFEMEEGQLEAFMHSEMPDIKIYIRFGKTEGQVIGVATKQDDECFIVISEELDVDRFANSGFELSWYRRALRFTTIHEIGHCFGLEHSSNPDDIMAPYYNPTADTEEAFKRFNEQLMEARGGYAPN